MENNTMQTILKSNINEILEMISAYAKNKEYKSIKGVEEFFKSMFDVDVIKFWKVDSTQDSLELLSDDRVIISLKEKSFLMKAINTKTAFFENHVTSNKYYNIEIDNPLELKVKSLIVFPIIKEKKVVAIVKLWRNIGNRKVFQKKDIEVLSRYIPLFDSIIHANELEKKELLTMIGKREEKKTENKVSNIETKSSKHIVKNNEKNNEKYETTIRLLKTKLEKSEEENNFYKQQIDETKDELNTLKNELGKMALENKNKTLLGEEHSQLKIKYHDLLESHKIEINEKSNNIKNLIEQNKLIAKNVKFLEEEKTRLKDKGLKYIKHIQTLQKELSSDFAKNSVVVIPKTEKTVERDMDELNYNHCKKLVDLACKHFNVMQHTRVMYELIVFAMHSPKGLSQLESVMEKSGLLNQILSEYSFRQTIPVYLDKHSITQVSDMMQVYCQNVFHNKIKLNVDFENDIPTYLYFDPNKANNILLNLLIDLFQFCDHNQEIILSIKYNHRTIYFTLTAKVHKKNSVFKFLSKDNNIFDANIGRVCLASSKKLTEYLNGTLKYTYKEYTYSYEVSLPASTKK